MVFSVNFEMLGEVIYPLRQQCNLHFRRTGIALVGLKIANNLLFFLLWQHFPANPFSHTHLKPVKPSYLSVEELYSVFGRLQPFFRGHGKKNLAQPTHPP
jgi:hypothetical protein